MCGKRVKLWKTMPTLGAQASDIALGSPTAPACRIGLVAHRLAADADLAFLKRLQQVDAAQERRLARAARPDQDDGLTASHVRRQRLQYLDVCHTISRDCGSRSRRKRRAAACQWDKARPPFDICAAPRQRKANDEIDGGDGAEDLERCEGPFDDLPTDERHIRQPMTETSEVPLTSMMSVFT